MATFYDTNIVNLASNMKSVSRFVKQGRKVLEYRARCILGWDGRVTMTTEAILWRGPARREGTTVTDASFPQDLVDAARFTQEEEQRIRDQLYGAANKLAEEFGV